MMTVRVADFEADYAALREIRFTVFVDEQNVPEDIEIDDRWISNTNHCDAV